MEKPIEHYWRARLDDLKEALEENNFEVFIADSSSHAKDIVLKEILPKSGAKSISWGGSMTFIATGIYEALKDHPKFEVIDVFDKSMPDEKKLEQGSLLTWICMATVLRPLPSAPNRWSFVWGEIRLSRIWRRPCSESKTMQHLPTPCGLTKKRHALRTPAARSAKAPIESVTPGQLPKNRFPKDGGL